VPPRAFSVLRVTLAVLVGAALIALALGALSLRAPEPYLERVEAPERSALRTPPEVPPSEGYAFERYQDGAPVTYDPCRPVTFVVSRTSEPAGGNDLLLSALEEVSLATGLEFVYEGDTNELPRPDRPVYQPLLYGPRFSPVLVAWSNPELSPDLGGRVLGRGGSSALTSDGESVLVTGALELDGPEIGGLIAGGDPASARATIVHELGHLVGLAHVGTPGELMNPVLDSSRTDLGPGDRYGLALAGSGPCFSGLDDLVLLESLADVEVDSQAPEHLHEEDAPGAHALGGARL
jgi:hypothetical protein